MTVGELKARMGVGEFQRWLEYSQHYPIGSDVVYLAAAIVAQCVMVAAGAKNVKLADFMPEFGPRKELTDTELEAKVRAIALG